jgi:hypothetical protein
VESGDRTHRDRLCMSIQDLIAWIRLQWDNEIFCNYILVWLGLFVAFHCENLLLPTWIPSVRGSFKRKFVDTAFTFSVTIFYEMHLNQVESLAVLSELLKEEAYTEQAEPWSNTMWILTILVLLFRDSLGLISFNLIASPFIICSCSMPRH